MASLQWMVRSLTFAIATAIVSTGAEARPTGVTSDGRNWDAARVEHNCKTDAVSDLHATLVVHAKYQNGFKLKLKRGYYRDDPNFRSRIQNTPPGLLLAKITDRLRRLSSSAETGALIYDVSTDGFACIWLIGQGGILTKARTELGQRPPSALLRAELHVDRRSVRLASRASEPPPDPRGIAVVGRINPQALSDVAAMLLPSVVQTKITEARLERLLILPVADFALVPFAALSIDRGLFGDHVATVLLPELDALLESGERSFAFSPHDVLIVGNPTMEGRVRRKGSVVQTCPRDTGFCFGAIPGASREASSVAELFNADPMIESTARVQAVRTQITRRRTGITLLWFATHGIADAVNPMDESFLALGGGVLKGAEIKRFFLPQHPLVVMSACQTGMGKVFQGGVFGLARAWYHAGAGQVLATLWSVDDAATARLMTRFARHLRTMKAAELALREAIRETPPGDRDDPALWSGFTIIGNPTALRGSN